jgi:osmotically-inducible protein OsmY
MNKGAALVGGVGIGAALMYFLDPDRGKRRRALVRDKVEATGNKVGSYAEKVSRDIRDRAYGVVEEAKSLLHHEEVTDDTLVEQVRSKLGDLSAVDVQATNGAVILTGSILADELPTILSTVGKVRGVKRVENQLRVLSGTENGDFEGTPEPLGAQA